jgi:hypothetical protein
MPLGRAIAIVGRSSGSKPNLKRLLLLAGATGLIGLTVAFSQTTSPSRPAAFALGGPPRLACAFPTQSELADLAGASDLVVAATVEGRPQVVTYAGINQPFTRYALRVRSVLRGANASGVLTVEEVGGVVTPILQPGPQVVFLQKVQRSDGLTTYFVVDGLNGTFLTRAAGMTRECPHGAAPSTFVVGHGADASEATFGREVRELRPTPPPHK